MQMRCKLPNEFAIRRPRPSSPGSACEFYEWACVGGGAARRPAPTLPCAALRPRHAAPHVAASLLRPGPQPAGQLLRMGLGRFPATVPATRQPATRWADHTSPGALQSLYPLEPLSRVFGWVLEAGGSEVSLQAPFPLGRQPWEVTDRRKGVDPYFGGRVAITLGRMEVQSLLGVLGF